MNSAPVIITGMHRSGTSMVASILHVCGLDLGDQEKLASGAEDNEYGFFENFDFININTTILKNFGTDWDLPQKFLPDWQNDPKVAELKQIALSEVDQAFKNSSRHWGWKDPRRHVLWFPDPSR